MPTFIDESGDTGSDPIASSAHFRLAAVWVPSAEHAEAIRDGIRSVRQQLKLRTDYEFKYSKTWNYPERRLAFFEAVMNLEFRFAASSIDKSAGDWQHAARYQYFRASGVALSASLRSTYLHALEVKQGRAPAQHLNELIIVDDNEDAKFLEAIKETFRDLGSNCEPRRFLIGKVRFGGSKPDEMIQLADMVCGAVGSHLDGNSTWFKMISSRSLGIEYLG